MGDIDARDVAGEGAGDDDGDGVVELEGEEEETVEDGGSVGT